MHNHKFVRLASLVTTLFAGGQVFAGVQQDAARCFNVAGVWGQASAKIELGQDLFAGDLYQQLLMACRKQSEVDGAAFLAAEKLPLPIVEKLVDELWGKAPVNPDAKYSAAKALLFAANSAGDAGAVRRSYGRIFHSALSKKDRDVLVVGGWVELNHGEASVAEQSFVAALQLQDSADVKKGLALSLIAQGRPQEAIPLLEGGLPETGEQLAGIYLSAAFSALAEKNYPAAIELARKSDGYRQSATAASLVVQGWGFHGQGDLESAYQTFDMAFEQDRSNEDAARGAVLSASGLGKNSALEKYRTEGGNIGALATEAVTDLLLRSGRRDEAIRLNGLHSADIAIQTSAGFREKSGAAGEGRLNIHVHPGAAVSMETAPGHLSFSANHFSVGNGAITREGVDIVGRQEIVGDQSYRIAGRLIASGDKVGIGFDVGLHRWEGPGKYTDASISRVPVTDSLRSIVGDAIVGASWKNQISFASRDPVGYGWASDQRVTGGLVSTEGAKNNAFVEYDGALMKDLPSFGSSYFVAGPAIHFGTYQSDQNAFGANRGGYWSPKDDFGYGGRAFFSTEEGGDVMFVASAKVMQYSRETLSGKSSTLGTDFSATLAKRLSDHVAIVAGVAARSSTGYADHAAFIGVQISFDKAHALSRHSVGQIDILQ